MAANILSAEHLIGRALLSMRASWAMTRWRPHTSFERDMKRLLKELTPGYTMVSLDRLKTLAQHARTLHQREIQGCVVECGTWRGGGLALIDWVFRQHDETRELWGFDSFEGLPPPGENDPKVAHKSYFKGWCNASMTDVEEAVRIAGGDAARLHLVKGWLSETLPNHDTGTIALLNVDVDWYDSVLCCLELLYDRVAPGGIINFDDYGRWVGCDQAVHDFLEKQGVERSIIVRTTRYGAWLTKPGS